ncbi:MAG: ExbD/TolR family protein [Verrucomicrobiales bacterium]
MKLALSLPERPFFLFFSPGLDLLGLLLALVTLAGVAAREGAVEIELPRSSLAHAYPGDDRAVVAMVGRRGGDLVYYVDRVEVAGQDFESRLRELAEERETGLVVLKLDASLRVNEQQRVIDHVGRSGLRCYLAVEAAPEEAAKARVVE